MAALALVALTSTASASPPVLGAELPASAPVIGPTVAHADQPAVATSGTTTLVVWQEDRGTADNVSFHIYGALVRGDGSPAEKADFPISVAQGAQTHPAVTWTGKNYLVVWQDSRNGNADIYGARVSAQGLVLDPAGLPIARGAGDETAPAVASDGRESLVAWSQRNTATGWDIDARRIDATGRVEQPGSPKLGNAALVIAATGRNEITPAISYGGTLRASPTGNFLVTWETTTESLGDIYATRITPAGRKLDAAATPLATTSGEDYGPKVAWDSSTPQWLAVWGYEDPAFGLGAVVAKRIRPQGTVIDLASIQVTYKADDPADVAFNPTVFSNGSSGYLVLYDRSIDLGSAQVESTGVALSGQTRPPAMIASNLGDGSVTPVATALGVRAYVAWANNRQIWGARFAPANPAGATLHVVTQSANPQQTPAIAWNGGEYLVAWADARGGQFTTVYATRVLPDGTILDSGGIKIAASAATLEPISIASDGRDFVVAWSEPATTTQHAAVRVARIRADGTDLDPTGVTLAKDAYGAAVASDGNRYLVVWSQYTSPDVQAAFLSSAAAVSPPFSVSSAPARELWPRVASNGSDYLVVWQDSRSGGADVDAARISGDGVVLDPAGIAVASTSDGEGWPAVASDGSDFLVAWSIPSSAGTRVLDAEVSSSGQADSGHVLDTASKTALVIPALAWTGSTYVAVWQARVASSVNVATVDIDGTNAGTVSAPIPTPAASFLSASSFALGSGADGAELAYVRLAAEPAYGGVPRVFIRTVK